MLVMMTLLCLLSAFDISADDLVAAIDANEALISICEADFRAVYVDDERPMWEGTWGYERGKAYLRGAAWAKVDDGSRFSYEEIYAFDGERLFTFQPEPERMGGTVRELRNEFSSQPSARTLLGHSLDPRGLSTLSALLEHSDDVRVISAQEVVNGTNCHLFSFVMQSPTSKPDVTVPNLVKVWIDPERNYRPLRIEKYRDAAGRSLKYVIDGIHLREFDGIWLPIQGTRTWHKKVPVPLGGHTLKGLMGMEREEARKHLRIDIRPNTAEAQRIEVSSWRVLDDIDDRKFTVVFPRGSRVWDYFAEQGLKIGEADGD